MIPLIIALLFGVVEYASAIALYRQFIYEETVQMGAMAGYIIYVQMKGGSGLGIGQGMGDHGIGPGRKDLEEWGWLIPWATEALEDFYTAAEYIVAVF